MGQPEFVASDHGLHPQMEGVSVGSPSGWCNESIGRCQLTASRLKILQVLMHRIQWDKGLPEPPKPCDYFVGDQHAAFQVH